MVYSNDDSSAENALQEIKEFASEWPDDPFARKRNVIIGIADKILSEPSSEPLFPVYVHTDGLPDGNYLSPARYAMKVGGRWYLDGLKEMSPEQVVNYGPFERVYTVKQFKKIARKKKKSKNKK